jgi:hypothetical protein
MTQVRMLRTDSLAPSVLGNRKPPNRPAVVEQV